MLRITGARVDIERARADGFEHLFEDGDHLVDAGHIVERVAEMNVVCHQRLDLRQSLRRHGFQECTISVCAGGTFPVLRFACWKLSCSFVHALPTK